MYYEIKQYIDENGHMIVERKPSVNVNQILKLDLCPKSTYSGTIQIGVRTQMGQGTMPFEFEFPENMSIEECFEKFEEIAEQKFEEFKKEKEDEKRIVAPPPGLIIPKK